MRARWFSLTIGLCFYVGTVEITTATGLDPEQPSLGSSSPRWPHGPPTDESFFPIGVWLQSPARATEYKAAGINVYVGLWRGPTAEQIAILRRAGMRVICAQNETGLAHKEDTTIVGWMHGDEPDNAQSRPDRRGYGPPIEPKVIVGQYQRMREADPTRPILLNLGQGVAWDNYIGRGVRRRHPEDYLEYLKGCDIASFDIYPVVHEDAEISGKLEYVAYGVRRLRDWTSSSQTVWNCIECTHISNPDRKANPAQVRAEVWMGLIHGSRGLIYFVHQFKPAFREAALLDDPEMLEAVTRLNQQITALAPVLNSSNVLAGVTVSGEPLEFAKPDSSPPLRLIAWMAKRWQGHLYLFTVNMRNAPARAEFHIPALPPGIQVTVLGEDRRLTTEGGRFADAFGPYEVHLYEAAPR